MFALFNAIVLTITLTLIVSVARFISESTALYEEKYHHRYGALKMPPEYIEILKMYKTQEHAFYGDMYREKLQQIKKGNH